MDKIANGLPNPSVIPATCSAPADLAKPSRLRTPDVSIAIFPPWSEISHSCLKMAFEFLSILVALTPTLSVNTPR